jgi:serine/threonine protein phosphatase PrpC
LGAAAALPPAAAVGANSSEDWFIVTACDGIWDVMSNDETCQLLQERFTAGKRAKQQLVAAQSSPGGRATPNMGNLTTSPLVGSPSKALASRRRANSTAQHVVLHGNQVNEVVADSVCAVMRQAMTTEPDEDEGLGMDNMSVIVTRLVMTL